MRQAWCGLGLGALLGLAVATLVAGPAAAKQDVLGTTPPSTKPELVIHPPGSDLSAYRIDCEVFGWNRAFTEVAAVGVETRRGPLGKHRGEAYLLAYVLGEPLPKHNIIAHTITHADLPHDPVPIEDARDLLWCIENSFLGMWPRQPYRKRPRGAMEVRLIWDPLVLGTGLCQPLVGFSLHWRGQHRFMPFVLVDMKVDCRNLRHTDTRTYWGRADVAAAMPRFDFSAQPSNERSARFVVSAAWHSAKQLDIAVRTRRPLDAAQRRRLLAPLAALGRVQVRGAPAKPGEASGGSVGVARIAAKEGYADLARYLARTLEAGERDVLGGDIDDVVDGFPDVVVEWGPMPPPRAPTPAPPPEAAPTAPVPPPVATPPTKERYLPSAMPPEAPPATGTQPAPQPQYINDWRP